MRNEQCQEMAQSDDQKWITSNGEWDTHTVSMWCVCLCSTVCGCVCVSLTCVCLSQVSLKAGTNILYWRTTGILVGGKMVKPVLLKNIQIEGRADETFRNPTIV